MSRISLQGTWSAALALMGLLIAGCRSQPAQPAPSASGQTRVDFERGSAGKLPPGFTPMLTGQGGPAQWLIETDATAPAGSKVLTQTTAESVNYRFPVCVATAAGRYKDVTASVAFRPISGKLDQAAGLVVRLQDKDNYYAVRANALEDNVRFYKMEKGQRKQLAGIDMPKPATGAWHTLSLTARGTHFQVSMDGKLLFEADDPTFQTPGYVGLWTKADSVTEFDDLSIHPISNE